MCHLVRTVLADDVVNDFAAALVVEVDVDVRQADPVGVQEPFEQQVVRDGIDVRDADTVGNGRTRGRTAARADAHAHVARSGGEVRDDEEVARVASVCDGLEFEVEAFADGIGDRRAIPAYGAEVGQVAQVGVLAALASVFGVAGVDEFRRDVKRGEQHIAFEGIGFAPRDDVCNAEQGLGNVGELGAHFVRSTQVEPVVRHAKPKLTAAFADVALRLAGIRGILDAQQDVVRLGLILSGVVRGICRYASDPMLRAKRKQCAVDHILFFKPVTVQFRIEAVSEHRLVPQEGLLGLPFADIENQGRNFAEEAAREADDVLRMRR